MELVLNTFGTSLVKTNDALQVIHKDGKQLIDPERVTSIIIGRGASITSDAAILALQHNIDVFFVDRNGEPYGRLWSGRFGSVSDIRRQQLDFVFSSGAVNWICEIVAKKLENQMALLLTLTGESEMEKKREVAVRKIRDYRDKVLSLKGEVVSDIAPSLRGWEGASSRVYFECISLFLPEIYRFEGRSQHPAKDVFNCLINYGYGILYGKVESALIKAGIDPYIGVFHRDDYNRPVLVFDVIEQFRVWVDYVAVTLLAQEVINEDCYSVRDDGSYWLDPLGKRILIQSLNDYMDEVILLNGIERSRMTHIQLFAHNFAQLLLTDKKKKTKTK